MARADQTEVPLRIVIEQPVAGVLHSLQSKDDCPLDPKRSASGEPLAFDLVIRVEPRPGGGFKVLGDQVRREGPERRFVYVRIGQAAGDPASPWTRRMKIDIHDIDRALMERGIAGAVLEGRVNGTAKDGSPACATVKPVTWRSV